LAYTPPLTNSSNNNPVMQADVKADLLTKTFFPPPPDANLSNINSYTYLTPLSMPDITLEEIKQIINQQTQ
jgi:hypothetical protein